MTASPDRPATEVGVPLLDLRAQYDEIRREIEPVIRQVIEDQAFILGPAVASFEQDVASYCQAAHAVGVSSGTDALLLALMALDIGPGDEVITSPYTFFATAGSISRSGARPVFVDIDPNTYNIDVAKIEAAITPNTRAIMPVHLFGQSVDMGPLLEIASRRGLHVVEDAAQAIGTEYRGHRSGSQGTVGCFSFFPSKNLGAFGDAGLVTTNDGALAERLLRLRVHGGARRYYHDEVGGNFRIDALQAAVLKVKLPHLERWTEGRRRNAAMYRARFEELGLTNSIRLPADAGLGRHIYNQFVIAVPGQRDALQQYLTAQGIGNAIYYPLPLHLQQCFSSLGYRAGAFPISEQAALETLALPIYPELTAAQLERVVLTIERFVKEQRV